MTGAACNVLKMASSFGCSGWTGSSAHQGMEERILGIDVEGWFQDEQRTGEGLVDVDKAADGGTDDWSRRRFDHGGPRCPVTSACRWSVPIEWPSQECHQSAECAVSTLEVISGTSDVYP